MNILFVVQGEGRGHLSQALAFSQILKKHNHKLVGTIVGSNNNLPEYFYNNIGSDVFRIDSFMFIKNNNKGINLNKTVFYNISKIGKYNKSLKKIDQIIKESAPDLIINFYEFMMGTYNFFYKNSTPMISIANQYSFDRSDYIFPDKNILDKTFLRIANNITSYKSHQKWALSFKSLNINNNIETIPPFLRKEVKNLKVENDNFYLAYIVNSGYLDNIIKISSYTDKIIEVYSNFNNIDDIIIPFNVKLFNLSDTFLERLSKCDAIISTAGFETVCESMYLGKPIYMMPIENHYEQKCNANNAEIYGAGIWCKELTYSEFKHFLNSYNKNNEFKDWIESNEQIIINKLNKLEI